MSTRNPRELLLQTAIDLFFQKGYMDTSIRDIGITAGISSSLVYHYFKDKEEVLFQIINSSSVELMEVLQETEARVSDPLECLREMLTAHTVRFSLKRKKEVKIIVEDQYFLRGMRLEIIKKQQREVYQLYYKKLQELGATGCMNEVDPTVLNFSLFGVINWFFRWYQEDGRLTEEEVADNLIKIIFHGIVKPDSVPGPQIAALCPDGGIDNAPSPS